MIEQVMPVELF